MNSKSFGDIALETQTTCPVTGLPVYAPAEWQNLSFGSPSFSVSVMQVGQQIIVTQVCGYATEHTARKYGEFFHSQVLPRIPEQFDYVFVSDYAHNKGFTLGARNRYLEFNTQSDRLKGIVFLCPSAIMRFVIALSRRVGHLTMPMRIFTSYDKAVKAARDLLISNQFHSIAQPFNPGPLSWEFALSNGAYRFSMIESDVMEMVYDALETEQDLEVFKTAVMQVAQFSGLHDFPYPIIMTTRRIPSGYSTRHKHLHRRMVQYFSEAAIENHLHMIVVYGIPWYGRLFLKIAGRFTQIQMRSASNRDDALKCIRNEKLRLHHRTKTLQKLEKDLADRIQIYAREVLDFMSRVTWGLSTNGTPAIPDHHPFRSVFDAIFMLKNEFEQLFSEKLSAEKEILERNRRNEIRAELWRLASDPQQEIMTLLPNLLKLLVDQVGLALGCYFRIQVQDSGLVKLDLVQEYQTDKNTISIESLTIPMHSPSDFIDQDFVIIHQDSTHNPEMRSVFDQLNLQSMLMLPVRVQGKSVGLFVFADGKKTDAAGYEWPTEIQYIFRELVLMVSNRLNQGAASRAIQRAYQDLEVKVLERTRDLKAMNEALELARERAEKASQAKSEFLARISHDVRTPLTVILGLSEIISNSANPDSHKRHADMISEEVLHVRELINTLLDLAKIEAGKMELSMQPFQLQDKLNKLISTFEAMAIEKGIEFMVDVDDDLPETIVGDALRLNQVLMNLVGNAFKFTSQGRIAIKVKVDSMSPDSVMLTFAIEDTGIGIPCYKLDSIFDTYTQAHNQDETHYGGTGLGTAIARELVQLMNGNIYANSEEGVGSVFWFTLPFGLTQRQFVEIRYHTQPDIVFDQKRILVVEDYVGTQLVIREMLVGLGFEVTIAGDGDIALTCLKSAEFDIILMDLQMPNRDGFSTARYIRHELKLTHLPIIAMSANTFEEDKRHACDAGMTDFLPKPIERQELIQLLKKALPL